MIEKVRIKKYRENEVVEQADVVIKEHRANIFVNGEHYISLMCLPQFLAELAVGFLYSEGIIDSYTDIAGIDSISADNIYVVLKQAPDKKKSSRRIVVSGFAQGSVNLSFINCENLEEASSSLKIKAAEIVKMAASFNEQSELFWKTGAVHSSALILADTTKLFAEDIGRHNAIDKIIGNVLISGLCVKNSILLTSGRISCEIIIKAARLGIPILISTSAPTNKAVEIAKTTNTTLIGFARGKSFNVYAGESRVE